MSRQRMLLYGSFGVFVVGVVFLAAGVSGVSASSARALTDAEQACLFGGFCDNYCVSGNFTCNNDWGSQCNALTGGSACFRCETDAQEEECDGDNWCIPYLTCTDCVSDPPHDCGMETAGTCSQGSPPYTCERDFTSDNDCGDAFRCHTS